MIGFFIVFVFAAIFLLINGKRKKKQYQLEASLESQKTILQSKEKFLENISHEIRTPITSIIGYLNLLSEENLVSEKRTKYTNIAIKNSNKMISSLNSFLTLVSSEKISLAQNEKTSFNLNDFILDRITYYIPDFEIKKMKFFALGLAVLMLVSGSDAITIREEKLDDATKKSVKRAAAAALKVAVAAKKAEAADAKIAKKLADKVGVAEAKLAEAKTSAMANLNDVAAEAAMAAVASLAGIKASSTQARKTASSIATKLAKQETN